jgi:hypothetical protein
VHLSLSVTKYGKCRSASEWWPRVSRMLQGLAMSLAASACGDQAARERAHTPLDQPPVDLQIGVTADTAAAWAHRSTHDVDLNANGSPGRLVVASDVTVMASGEPLWEDGHRWAIYVEEGDRRTLLYAAFLPHGTAEVALAAPDELGRRDVVVVERTPQHSRTLVVAYDSVGSARTVSFANYPLERWLPSLTATRSPSRAGDSAVPAPAATPAPWSRDSLAAAAVPAAYPAAWRAAENRATCAVVAPAATRVPNAQARTAVFSGGWGVAYDAPGERSLFGVAGTGATPGNLYQGWTRSRAWSDGSRAIWGPEGGRGPNQLAYLRIAGQGCLYNVWSRVGEPHLAFLLDQLRFVRVE